MSVVYEPIGVIRSSFTKLEGMPIQPVGAGESLGELQLNDEFAPGLVNLDGFSRCILIYHFHKSRGFKLKVTPFMDTVQRGLFSTRAPKRPNAVGLSIVEILSIEDNVVRIKGVDVLDNTPLLDIKPYVPRFDAWPEARCGWLETNAEKAVTISSDDRFTRGDIP
ncbi:MAG: tRNA (N6-threonylcarbamoyladenosine(37)-N6)-methyltransferase TrmO [Desulfovibrio sp.]|nr:MAG: tRNA (N6-threonylcarbamoyladenosine(37)-N6)-methyltransferase TrmO [Desulfovibrio sp.]